MTAQILTTPARHVALHDARQVAHRPDLYDNATILDACAVLACWGDWLDVTRATELRRAVAAEQRAEVRLPWWAWCALGALALAFGIVAAEALVSMAEAATAAQIAAGAVEW